MQRCPQRIIPLNMINSIPTLNYLPAQCHTHRMSNYNNLRCFCISQNSFNKFSYICQILFGMVDGFGLIRVCISPCCSVELCLFISLSHEIRSKTSESSLPLCIAIYGSHTKRYITISMQEDNWCFDNPINSTFSATKRPTLDITSIKRIRLITYHYKQTSYHCY